MLVMICHFFPTSNENVSLNFGLPLLFGNSVVLENCCKETQLKKKKKSNATVNANHHLVGDFLSKKE